VKQFYTRTPIQGGEKLHTFAAAATRQQQAIIRMMTSSRTDAVCPCRSQNRLWQRTLLRHTYYILTVRRQSKRFVELRIANLQLLSCYITEMVQASAKVTIECQHEVLCNLYNGVMTFSDR